MNLYNEKRQELEDSLISCILQKHELINELYIDNVIFKNHNNANCINFFKKFYKQYKTLDITLMISKFKTEEQKQKMFEYWNERIAYIPSVSLFYKYQEELQEIHKNEEIEKVIDIYKSGKIEKEELIFTINEIQNKSLIISNNHKKLTPEEMLQKIRNKEKLIQFDRLYNLNQRVKIKKRTLNVIAARPSEGKSALALNLFCDLSKSYKCIYFNMEMTEEEIYERMLGIESSIPIEQIIKPQTDYQEETIKEVANKIYSYKYEVVNGSMNIKGLVSKIIREQREEHLIVFIDYVGYISNKAGQSDKDRIGEVTRMLNDVTKDYNCTIMLVAQINRNGSDTPTMEDLKDSGELEQSADTIILIHDENKQDVSSTKFIKLLIPKCRGSKRNIAIEVKYLKESQRMEVL
jgi:replicative DNA helicase